MYGDRSGRESIESGLLITDSPEAVWSELFTLSTHSGRSFLPAEAGKTKDIFSRLREKAHPRGTMLAAARDGNPNQFKRPAGYETTPPSQRDGAIERAREGSLCRWRARAPAGENHSARDLGEFRWVPRTCRALTGLGRWWVCDPGLRSCLASPSRPPADLH